MSLDNSKIIVNVTIKNYHVTTYSQEQLSFSGAISGTLSNKYSTRVSKGVNISLWQNGQILDIPQNPQSSYHENISGRDVDFIFEHLAPGQYEVMAEYRDSGKYTDNVSVFVNNEMVSTNITLTRLTPHVGTPSPAPSTSPTAIPANTPTPFPGVIMILLSIGVAALLILKPK